MISLPVTVNHFANSRCVRKKSFYQEFVEDIRSEASMRQGTKMGRTFAAQPVGTALRVFFAEG